MLLKLKFLVATLRGFIPQLNVRTWGNNLRIFLVQVRLIFSSNRDRLFMEKHRLNRECLERAVALPEDGEEELPVEVFRIWTMWWQGEDMMPPIVRATYSSIRRATEKEVVLITKDNYRCYVSFPDYIIRKIEKGRITMMQLSDIVRASLLYEHGGAWIDSTMLCAKRMPEHVFNSDLFSIKAITPPCDLKYIAHGRWNVQLLATRKRHLELFSCMRYVLLEYWRKYDVLMDYLLVDSTIDYIYRRKERTRRLIDGIPATNPRTHDMCDMLNDIYDKAIFDSLVSETVFFKLTYKKKFMEYRNGRQTFYGFITTDFGQR